MLELVKDVTGRIGCHVTLDKILGYIDNSGKLTAYFSVNQGSYVVRIGGALILKALFAMENSAAFFASQDMLCYMQDAAFALPCDENFENRIKELKSSLMGTVMVKKGDKWAYAPKSKE